MKEIRIDNTSRRDFHQFMLGAIVPRPIALVGTVSLSGIRNLAPFSYFNAVSSLPPILMFSLSRKGTDGAKKDTLLNIEQTGGFTVNIVNYRSVGPMVLSSVEFPSDIDEFEKTGFTPIGSQYITAPRVKECPIHFECRLREIKELGQTNEDCTIVFGDVVCMYIDESVLDENNRIDPKKLDIIGRMGRTYYNRVSPGDIFSIPQAMNVLPIGYDRLPEHIKMSETLSANEIARLAGIPYEIYEKHLVSLPQLILKKSEEIEKQHLAIREALSIEDQEKAALLMFGV